jgi:hypothetical protein
MAAESMTAPPLEFSEDLLLTVLIVTGTLMTSLCLISPFQITEMAQVLLGPIYTVYGSIIELIQVLLTVYDQQQANTKRLLPEGQTYSFLDWLLDAVSFWMGFCIVFPVLALCISYTVVIDIAARLVLFWTVGPLREDIMQWWTRNVEDQQLPNLMRFAWRWL